ncbi:CheY-like chemotaxis protein [Janthinobacterium sp. CG_23.3]|uniref:hybrid sensor histidine kinase/response regulator n=1 Tax=unclassified Janthinobacterium TaxID=2610881 RepID=UPI00034A87DD|nr:MULTISPECIES: response regulator [unclassified Janthinobacterium]MEC5160540.1 CheY-like chemotaxis protein [Janthinobacterium sp. CG_S6]
MSNHDLPVDAATAPSPAGGTPAEWQALRREVAQLREANQNLTLAALSAQTLRDEAEASSQRQNEFLSTLAHELRNPLAPISMAAILLGRVADAPPQVASLQDTISRQVEHMSRLLDELLDVARIRDGKATLPLSRTPDAASPAPKRQVAAAGYRILLVEDNADASATLRDFLQLEGHTVSTAYDGTNGLAMARGRDYDVLICDIGLPGMNGFDLIRELRASTDTHIPFAIALSGYGQPQDRARAIMAGFGHYFVKPVDVDALLALIASSAVSKLVAPPA